MTEPVTIVGAAIAGPAAALCLARAGHDVTVYDARPENELFSAGILGMNHGVCNLLQDAGADVFSYELPNMFWNYNTGQRGRSPFVYIAWTDVHRAITSAARKAGAKFTFGQHVNPATVPGTVVDATGIAGAARLGLAHKYLGVCAYRGLSSRWLGEDFVFLGQPDHQQKLITGDTRLGAVWTLFTHRKEPVSRTVTLKYPPAGYHFLPEQFRRVIRATDTVLRSPMSWWATPKHMMEFHWQGRGRPDRQYLTIGDVNGPIHPITTSGANLAVIEGMNTDKFIGASPKEFTKLENEMLGRRIYDLQLGLQLAQPEIGGIIDDPDYDRHHAALFPGDLA